MHSSRRPPWGFGLTGKAKGEEKKKDFWSKLLAWRNCLLRPPPLHADIAATLDEVCLRLCLFFHPSGLPVCQLGDLYQFSSIDRQKIFELAVWDLYCCLRGLPSSMCVWIAWLVHARYVFLSGRFDLCSASSRSNMNIRRDRLTGINSVYLRLPIHSFDAIRLIPPK